MPGFNRNTDAVQSFGSKVKMHAVINTLSAAPTIQDSNMPGVTVTHPATGTYQLNNVPVPAGAALALVSADLGFNASTNSAVIYDKTTLVSAGVLKIYLLTAGVAADLATPGEISVEITFKNTSPARP